MRRIAKVLMEAACSWIETAPPLQVQHDLLLECVQNLTDLIRRGTLTDLRAIAEVHAAADLLDQCTHLPTWSRPSELVVGTPSSRPPYEGAADSWLAHLPEGRVVSKHTVQRDAGQMLDWLDESLSTEVRQQVKVLLEQLLRHVEVQRDRCLTEFAPSVSSRGDRWLQYLDVAILFSRHARRTRDVRYLNGALKLNDVATAGRATKISSAVAARFVLSLAEQEFSFVEWNQSCVSPFSLPSKTVSTRAS